METIMIQDADDAIVYIVSTALKMHGYHVCNLTNQHENILERIRRHRPRLVLLDCWLANHSGKLCQWIKTHYPRLPVVAFSCDDNIDQHFRLLGFDDYLKKPFDLEELYGLVRKFIPAAKKRRPRKREVSY